MIAKLLPGVFPERTIPLAILLLLTVTNLVGADFFAQVKNFFAFILVIALVLLSLCLLTEMAQPVPSIIGTAMEWNFSSIQGGSFLGLIVLAMWLMVGSEYICPMINEVHRPDRNIPRVMSLHLLAMLVIFSAFAIGAGHYLSVVTLTTSPLPYADYASAVFGKWGLMIAVVMGITATCSTLNTVLAAIPRMLQGMAENGQVFP